MAYDTTTGSVPGGLPEIHPAGWAPAAPPRVGVSSCLLGHRVRYDGGHKRDPFLTEVLGDLMEFVPTCPEVRAGLGTPGTRRETVHLTRGENGDTRMVAAGSGADHTVRMVDFARGRVAELGRLGLCGYVLKSKSPSCAPGNLPVYAGTGGVVEEEGGQGLFAAALTATYPLLAVEDEAGLRDPDIRGHFVERVLAHAALRELFGRQWHPDDLLAFHERHVHRLITADPALAEEAERVAHTADRRPAVETADAYTTALLRALAVRPGRARPSEHRRC